MILTYVAERCQTETDFANYQSVTRVITTAAGVCIPVETMSITELCYIVTLMYQSTTVMVLTNMKFRRCLISTFESQLGSEVTFTLSHAAISGTVAHTTVATLGCANTAFMLSGDKEVLCHDGVWEMNGSNSCFGKTIIIIPIIVIERCL